MKSGLAPIVFPKSIILVLGTMPSEKSIACQQYYANGTNAFWRLISDVLGEAAPSDCEGRTKLLREHGIALWDVLASCDRIGSSDSAITNEVPNDFEGFFRDHPTIKTVFFNGKKAERLYEKRVKCNYGATFVRLPSSSSALAIPYTRKATAWTAIAHALGS